MIGMRPNKPILIFDATVRNCLFPQWGQINRNRKSVLTVCFHVHSFSQFLQIGTSNHPAIFIKPFQLKTMAALAQ
jgi:hypothetical protein